MKKMEYILYFVISNSIYPCKVHAVSLFLDVFVSCSHLQVLVRVRAVGINPVEALVQTGQFAIKPDLPYTPGHDAAGEVAALGNGVTGVKVR